MSTRENTRLIARAPFSEESFEHLKEHNSYIKQDILVEFRRIVCWMSGQHY